MRAYDYTILAGARFEVLDGPHAGMFCETDQTGRCTLPDIFSGAAPQTRASKEGFIPASGANEGVSQDGSRVIGWSLKSTKPPAMIAGTYSLGVHASATCADLPLDLRTRTYTVTITTSGDGTWAGGDLLDYTYFVGGLAGDSVSFGFINDSVAGFYDGGAVLEQLGPDRFFTAIGRATGSISGSTIAMIFDGRLSVQGRLDRPVATCQAHDHQFTFVRQ